MNEIARRRFLKAAGVGAAVGAVRGVVGNRLRRFRVAIALDPQDLWPRLLLRSGRPKSCATHLRGSLLGPPRRGSLRGFAMLVPPNGSSWQLAPEIPPWQMKLDRWRFHR